MVAYPRIEDEQRIPAEVLKQITCEIFLKCGMDATDAELLTDTLIAADLRGTHSHGVLRIPDYIKKLTQDGVDPKGRPIVIQDRAAAIVVDGGNSMGQIGGGFAMQKAIERAKTVNLSFAAVRGSNHCGAMAYFAMMALAHEMLGIAATNALPTMAPWGGTAKIVGINPLAVAIPAGSEHPVVLDAAFSASSHGKIRVYHQKGVTLPEHWAFDTEGKPTTDPALALDGLLQPIGGYKGTGLAIVTGLLCSLLSGASYGTELGNMIEGPKAGQDGHFFVAINIAAFEEITTFRQRMDTVIRQIQESPRAPGVDRLYAPGGLEAETEVQYRREGIPLNAETLNGILTAAAELSVDATPLMEQ